MSKKKKQKKKHIPQRTCIGCRSVQSKRSLIRVVRTPEGVFIDQSGKLSGRGAYLHDSRTCWEKGLKGLLARALKTQLSPADHEHLSEFMVSLNDENSE